MPEKRLRYLVPLQRHNIHHQTGQIQSIEKKITGQRLANRNWGRTSQQSQSGGFKPLPDPFRARALFARCDLIALLPRLRVSEDDRRSFH